MATSSGKVFLKRSKGNRSKVLAIFSYLGMLCFVPLIFNRNDEYVHFHARQGLVLWIWGVLAIFSLHIPLLGAFIFSSSVIFVMILSVIGISSVVLSRAWRLPLVAFVADRM
ncbi:MAG: hypothetical protein HQL52_02790 [Magnetococcales bacterium]|nr:hypothetical protein [Magnetococcales bacterium]